MSRLRLSSAAGAGLAVLLAGAAQARPFGTGTIEPAIQSIDGGWFAPLLHFVAVQQGAFYQAMQAALMASGGASRMPWLLVGLGFAYGVFHAIGPGHGKAVIASYVLADRPTLRRAVTLSFVAALAQALTAIVLVLAAVAVIGMTSQGLSRAAHGMEVAGYAVLTAFGAVLVWRKIVRPAQRRLTGPAGLRSAASFSGGGAAMADFAPHGHAHHHADDGHDRHDRHAGEAGGDAHCGHSHAVSAEDVRAVTGLREAAALVASIGLRPCSGALIVLVYAMVQGMGLYGVAATLAMSLGTGLTVAAFATAAAGGRGLANRLAGPATRTGAAALAVLEGGAAVAVLLVGLLMLAASLAR